MNNKIKSLISGAAEADSKNRLSVDQIRKWLAEYLEMYQEDLRRFPDLVGKSHADLIMADFDKSRLALFIVAVFSDNTVVIAAGRGESYDIRGFLEKEAPINADDMISKLASRFFISDIKVTVNRREFTDWLY